jgi:Tol biopolymer transport system component
MLECPSQSWTKKGGLVNEASEDEAASWSRDGKWIYFGSNRSNGWQVWRVPAGGGTAEQITRGGGFAGLESADGKFLYYVKDRYTAGLWRVPSTGGEEIRILDAPAEGDWSHLAVTARGIYFIDRTGSIPRLKLLSGKDGSVATVVELIKGLGRDDQGGPAPGFTVSPDGSWIVYPLTEAGGADIRVAENFQ